MGGPFIGIGYSDEIGWTHTNNTIQNTNLYELTLNPNFTYNFGGTPLPLEHRTDIIKIRQADGSLANQSIDIFTSVQGPVIAQNGNKALALRVAGLDQPSVVTQYWKMIQAHNLDEFIDANSALQMPFFNVIYADRRGHILYSICSAGSSQCAKAAIGANILASSTAAILPWFGPIPSPGQSCHAPSTPWRLRCQQQQSALDLVLPLYAHQ